MTERILRENQLIVKLNELRKEYKRAEEKFTKVKSELEEFEKALVVFNKLAPADEMISENLIMPLKDGESDVKKLAFIKEALAINSGTANYNVIHKYLTEKQLDYKVTPQSTYAFIKRKTKTMPDIQFVGHGVFKLTANQPT